MNSLFIYACTDAVDCFRLGRFRRPPPKRVARPADGRFAGAALSSELPRNLWPWNLLRSPTGVDVPGDCNGRARSALRVRRVYYDFIDAGRCRV